MPTNHLGQQTTDSGHVITESERIAEALRTVAPGLTAKHYAKITNYVLDYAHTDWSKNVRHGVALGRKDAIVMLKALADDKQTFRPTGLGSGIANTIEAIPLTELQKIITALEETK